MTPAPHPAPASGPNLALGRLGGQLGVLLCLVGFAAIFFGWNGAAGSNVPMAQFPYLISGGIAGLAIVVVGSALLVVQSAREDRARVEATLERLIVAVERSAPASPAAAHPAMGATAGLVLAGVESYHRVDCSLPAAREEAHLVGLDEALTSGREACRVCRPPAYAPAAHR